jgi:hypothetical protein
VSGDAAGNKQIVLQLWDALAAGDDSNIATMTDNAPAWRRGSLAEAAAGGQLA